MWYTRDILNLRSVLQKVQISYNEMSLYLINLLSFFPIYYFIICGLNKNWIDEFVDTCKEGGPQPIRVQEERTMKGTSSQHHDVL